MSTRVFLLLFINLSVNVGAVQKLKIGGIFDYSESNEELAFHYAVSVTNTYHSNTTIRLIPATKFIPANNTLAVSKAACALLQEGVVAIFGPTSPIASPYVQSLCDNKEIPHIETHWNKNQQRSLVNLYPHASTLATVYVDIVKKWDWKHFTILYHDDDSLPKINELLRHANDGFVIAIKQLELDDSLSYRTVLNLVKNSGETHFVVACSVNVLQEVLDQAQQVGIITERYHFLITNLDMHTINLAPYQYGGCNITGVRLVDPEHGDTIDIAENLENMKQRRGQRSSYGHVAAWGINVKTALLMDAVAIFFDTLIDFKATKRFDPKSLLCNGTESWEHGYSIINFLKTKTMHGLTGLVKFDNLGFRTEFGLDIVELRPGGLTKVGIYNSTEGINISRIHIPDETLNDDEGSLQNKSFIVITALTPPYGLLKETTTKLSGNDRFEGFGIDLIHELSTMLGFNYTFIIQDDGANGNYNRRTKQWNGMIREVMDGRADLAITDLTITSERENAVDFTMPFMNLGISILYRKPEPVPPSLFTFASPFSIDVWLLLGVAYFFVSLSLFLIGRLCPSEWTNPYPCVEEPDFLINQFSFRNSLWFTIGSLMQQGTEIAPIGMSTRMVAGAWWFFSLIMVSSYTANLAAFLTVETLVTPFKNINELSQQIEIKYGAKIDGATSNFFRDSDISAYKTIWKHLYRNPEDMTTDNDEGVRRVEVENYAFLMESTTIEYIVERHCTLAQVGGMLDEKGYGIAMRKDSQYRHVLSAAVVKLQETGRLTALKIKWWKEKHGAGNCIVSKKQFIKYSGAAGEATSLGLKNVEGVFFILTLGTVLGFMGTFAELAVHVLRRNYNDRSKFKKEYIKEIKFSLDFKKRRKSVKGSEGTSPSSSEVIDKTTYCCGT